MTRAYSSLASVLVAVILNRRAGLTWKVFMTAPMADFSSDAFCEAQALVEAHLLHRGCAESLVKEPQRQCRGSFVTRPVGSKKATRVAPKWVLIFDRPTVLVPRRSQRWP
jgi:hypothetical protein